MGAGGIDPCVARAVDGFDHTGESLATLAGDRRANNFARERVAEKQQKTVRGDGDAVAVRADASDGGGERIRQKAEMPVCARPRISA